MSRVTWAVHDTSSGLQEAALVTLPSPLAAIWEDEDRQSPRPNRNRAPALPLPGPSAEPDQNRCRHKDDGDGDGDGDDADRISNRCRLLAILQTVDAPPSGSALDDCAQGSSCRE